MAIQTPGCCDTEWELLYKIVLQFQAISGDPSLIPPSPNDSPYDLYRKWLLALDSL